MKVESDNNIEQCDQEGDKKKHTFEDTDHEVVPEVVPGPCEFSGDPSPEIRDTLSKTPGGSHNKDAVPDRSPTRGASRGARKEQSALRIEPLADTVSPSFFFLDLEYHRDSQQNRIQEADG